MIARPWLPLALASVLVLGASACLPAPQIGFGKSALEGATSSAPTSLQFGPDARLYAAQFDGIIKAYTIERTAANDYEVSATETIDLIQQIPNHDDDGTLNPNVSTRLVTGMLVTGSATNPVIFVTSSDPRIGAGTTGELTNLDTNSSMLSKLTRAGSGWERRDLVRGLPRSQENHAANGIAFDAAANTLYIAQGGNTNRGAPSHNFNFMPEFAYSAAILRVDVNAIGNVTYDLPTLVSENYPTLTGPFGGDFGRRQARLVPGSPVQVHAPGFRNAYDILINSAGRMYTVDNGSNAGWGDVPVNEGPGGNCTNAVQEPGKTSADTLHLITGPGHYGGHPNPTRGNAANTFNQSIPQSPVLTANPVECDYRSPRKNGSLTSFANSTTGFAEYRASNFASQLRGSLIIGGWYGDVYRVKLNQNGNGVTLNEVLFTNVAERPIDVVAQGDSGPFPGTIWVADFATGDIWVLEPNDYGGISPPPCSGADNPSIDEDHDGFTNADEIDNGTSPCSAADAPHDWDGDFFSDLNDPDDDNDAIADNVDRFAVDPANGLDTQIPVSYTWNNEDPSAGGLVGLGWTGLMTDNTTDYADLYDAGAMTAGGAAGVMTIDAVPAGSADGSGNTQQFGFQFGLVASPGQTGAFTVHTRIAGPFAGLTPQGSQSMGVFVGTGDQDNYAKLIVTANGGAPGVQYVKEVGATPVVGATDAVALPGPDSIDLYLTVDPETSTVQPAYRVNTGGGQGSLIQLGAPTAIPTEWLVAPGQGLALGVISTSAGAPPFPATWDLIEATPGGPS
jgi:hypothetical protein